MQDRTQQSRILPPSFYDDKGNLTPVFLDKLPKELGKRFINERVSSSQLRRFYGDFKQLQHKMQSDKDFKDKISSDKPEDLQKYLPLIKMLKAKVAYGARPRAEGRPLLSQGFKQTIEEGIELIRTPRDFQAFALFLECTVGYYYGEGGEKVR
jgi:CRISPR type III-A-associated protein Csm2